MAISLVVVKVLLIHCLNYGQGAGDMGNMAYGQQAGKNQDWNNIWGVGNLFGSWYGS